MTDLNYTDAQLEDAKAIVADDQLKRAAAAAAKRAAYGKAARGLTAMAEWPVIRNEVARITDTVEDDGLISIHVRAIGSVMQRLEETVSMLPSDATSA